MTMFGDPRAVNQVGKNCSESFQERARETLSLRGWAVTGTDIKKRGFLQLETGDPVQGALAWWYSFHRTDARDRPVSKYQNTHKTARVLCEAEEIQAYLP